MYKSINVSAELTYSICSCSWILVRFRSFSWYGECVSKPSWQQVLTILIRWKTATTNGATLWCLLDPHFSVLLWALTFKIKQPFIKQRLEASYICLFLNLLSSGLSIGSASYFAQDPSGATQGNIEISVSYAVDFWTVSLSLVGSEKTEFLPQSVEVREAPTFQKVIGNGLC